MERHCLCIESRILFEYPQIRIPLDSEVSHLLELFGLLQNLLGPNQLAANEQSESTFGPVSAA